MKLIPPTRAGQVAIAVGLTALGAAALSLTTLAPAAVPVAPVAASLTVALTAPQAQSLVRTVAASGSVSARDELAIGADTSGVRLVEVLADVGSTVRRGQLLARGDDSQLLAQIAQQEALIRERRADLAQAQANFERAESVADVGVYSEEAVQTRRSSAESAAARLELALAQLRELNVHWSRTRVLAPADGVVSRRSATVGTVMQPGAELFRLMKDGEVEWQAELPAAALASVAPGAKARLALADGSSLEGRVRLVAPTIDAKSRNGIAYVSLPRHAALKAGGHASGTIAVGDAQVMTLPEAAVISRDGQPYVYTVGSDDIARLVRIETGARREGVVEVNGGLAAGARVVALGAGFVKDGERVRVAARS
jgi:HlyD family secretion protein